MTEGGFLLNNALASFDISAPGSEKSVAGGPMSYTNVYAAPPLLEPQSQGKEVSSQNSSIPSPFQKRVKRFESIETGPKATVWVAA